MLFEGSAISSKDSGTTGTAMVTHTIQEDHISLEADEEFNALEREGWSNDAPSSSKEPAQESQTTSSDIAPLTAGVLVSTMNESCWDTPSAPRAMIIDQRGDCTLLTEIISHKTVLEIDMEMEIEKVAWSSSEASIRGSHMALVNRISSVSSFKARMEVEIEEVATSSEGSMEKRLLRQNKLPLTSRFRTFAPVIRERETASEMPLANRLSGAELRKKPGKEVREKSAARLTNSLALVLTKPTWHKDARPASKELTFPLPSRGPPLLPFYADSSMTSLSSS